MRANVIKMRRAEERHRLQSGGQNMWLTFFPEHRLEPLAQGFGPLAALNEGVLAPEGTMLTYARRGSEIITYVIAGTLSHKDGGGRRSHVLRAGDFQRTLVNYCDHASFANASGRQELHVVQLSLVGDAPGPGRQHPPEQKSFPSAQRAGALRLVAGPDGPLGSLHLAQDARVYSGVFATDQELVHDVDEGRITWLQVLRGELTLDGLLLTAGDGVGVDQAGALRLQARAGTELLLLDLVGSHTRRSVHPDGHLSLQFAERALAHG